MNKKIVIGICLVLVTVGLLSGCNEETTETVNTITFMEPDGEAKLKLITHDSRYWDVCDKVVTKKLAEFLESDITVLKVTTIYCEKYLVRAEVWYKEI